MLLKYEDDRKTREDILIAIILTVITTLGVSMIVLNSNGLSIPIQTYLDSKTCVIRQRPCYLRDFTFSRVIFLIHIDLFQLH